MYGHMPPDTPRSGEHHLAVPTLVHPHPLVGPQVAVETAPAEEGLAALEAYEWSLSRVRSRVLLQVGGLLEDGRAEVAVVLTLSQLSLGWIVDRAEPEQLYK